MASHGVQPHPMVSEAEAKKKLWEVSNSFLAYMNSRTETVNLKPLNS